MAQISGRPVKISGTGVYIPQDIMTNADFEKFLDTNDEWITTRTGIKQRHFAQPGVKTSDLAYRAALEALKDAGISAKEIDMILVGSATPDLSCPTVSAKVQGMLGASNAGALDTLAACTSSLSAMSIAASGIASGIWNNVLVIGAESFRDYLDWTDRGTCILFGDGAGAAVLSVAAEGEGRFLSTKLCADGTKADFITIESAEPHDPRVVRMKGSEVFKFVNKVMPEFLDTFCEESGISPQEVDFWVMHQANTRINEGVLKRLNVPLDRTYMNLANYGNTSSASMMITLHEALKAGYIKKGGKITLVAFGGGMTLGALLYEA